MTTELLNRLAQYCDEFLIHAVDVEGKNRGIERDLAEKAARLDSLSPLKVLSRGYSLVYKGEKLLNSSETIEKGDSVNTLSFEKLILVLIVLIKHNNITVKTVAAITVSLIGFLTFISHFPFWLQLQSPVHPKE